MRSADALCAAPLRSAIIEALALTGALDPALRRRASAPRRSPSPPPWLGRGDPEAHWTGRDRRGRRLSSSRGCGAASPTITDRAGVPGSAEARKLHALIERAGREPMPHPLDADRQPQGAPRRRADEAEAEAADAPMTTKPRPREAGKRPADARASRSPARPSCSTRCSPRAARACRSSATRASAR